MCARASVCVGNGDLRERVCVDMTHASDDVTVRKHDITKGKPSVAEGRARSRYRSKVKPSREVECGGYSRVSLSISLSICISISFSLTI